jgi:hypothetical protein
MFSEARRRSSQSLHTFRHGGVLFKDFAERRRRRTEAVLRSWSAGDLWALAKHDSDDEGDEKGAVQKNSLVAGMPLHGPSGKLLAARSTHRQLLRAECFGCRRCWVDFRFLNRRCA